MNHLFINRYCVHGRDLMKSLSNQLPMAPSFEIEQFDCNRQIVPEFGHFLWDHPERIPNHLVRMARCLLKEDGNSMTDAVVISSCKQFFMNLLTGCIETARQRLINGEDEPVPFWFRRTDKICWLIPVRTGITTTPDLALVLVPTVINDIESYHAVTVLTLKDAFKSARVVKRVTAEWLRNAWK